MTPDLTFNIEGMEAMRFAASPHVACKLHVETSDPAVIHSVILKSQIQLEVSRRRYNPSEQGRLIDLFGAPDRWGQTLRPLLWACISTTIPSFTGNAHVDLPVPCSFDFNASATKYFAGVEEGDVPVTFLFSGTVFYQADNGALQAGPIAWEKEASCHLPIRVWRELMDAHYPNTAWLCLEREVFQRLNTYKTRYGIPTFEQALSQVMDAGEGEAS